MLDDEGDNLKIRQQCNAFSIRSSQITSNTELYVVFGGSKSGKSITVDLLAGKNLILYDDVELGTEVIVQQQNYEQFYPEIYIIDNKETVIMQSFTLDENFTNSKFQVLKLLYLEQFISIVGKVSFIIVFDETMVRNIQALLQHFLYCLGISSQKIHENIDVVKEYVNFFVTKTQAGFYEQAVQILQELRKETLNQNISNIINHIIYNQRIAQFQIKTPSKDFGSRIKQKFNSKKNRKQLGEILKNSSIRTQRLQQPHFSAKNQFQIVDIYNKISKMLTSLILYSDEKAKNYRKNFEDIAKLIFSSHKRKNQIDLMLGNWNLRQLKVVQLEIPKNINQKKTMERLTSILAEILIILEKQLPQTKLDYIEINGMLIFCSKLRDWLDQQLIAKGLQQIVKDVQQIARQIRLASPPKQPIPMISKSNLKKKPTPFSIFKEQIQTRCESNKDVILFCIKKIKQKEQTPNYDYFEVIYHIKLLRDILEQLNNAQLGIFIDLLLQISLYCQNFYLFNTYLKFGTQYALLNHNSAIKLIKSLLELKKYEQCQVILKYAQGLVSNQEHYKRLANLKVIVHKSSNQLFQIRYEEENRNFKIVKRLPFTMGIILQKQSNSKTLQQMLQTSTFKKYLTNSKE